VAASRARRYRVRGVIRDVLFAIALGIAGALFLFFSL
jgi:hypothetical protein